MVCASLSGASRLAPARLASAPFGSRFRTYEHGGCMRPRTEAETTRTHVRARLTHARSECMRSSHTRMYALVSHTHVLNVCAHHTTQMHMRSHAYAVVSRQSVNRFTHICVVHMCVYRYMSVMLACAHRCIHVCTSRAFVCVCAFVYANKKALTQDMCVPIYMCVYADTCVCVLCACVVFVFANPFGVPFDTSDRSADQTRWVTTAALPKPTDQTMNVDIGDHVVRLRSVPPPPPAAANSERSFAFAAFGDPPPASILCPLAVVLPAALAPVPAALALAVPLLRRCCRFCACVGPSSGWGIASASSYAL